LFALAPRSSCFGANGAGEFVKIIDDALAEAVELRPFRARQLGVCLDGVEKAGGERGVDALEELQDSILLRYLERARSAGGSPHSAGPADGRGCTLDTCPLAISSSSQSA
jgi:hypothetical protein